MHHTFDTLCSHTLERIGTRSRLICTAAQHIASGILHFLCNIHNLGITLNGAGATDYDDFLISANLDTGYIHDGIRRMKQTVRLFIRCGNACDIFDKRMCLHQLFIDFGGIANQTEDIVIISLNHGNGQPLVFKGMNQLFNLCLGSIFF